MRHVKTALGVAAAVCAFGATAAPALGGNFIASRNAVANKQKPISPVAPARTIGRATEGEFQEFRLGKYLIKCEKAAAKGEVTEPVSQTFTTTVKYSRCGYYFVLNGEEHVPAVIKGGITYKYLINGSAKVEGNGEGEENEFGVNKVEILETAAQFKIPAGKLCTIIVPQQTVPVRSIAHPTEEFSSAVYSNEAVEREQLKAFPTGFQQKLIIANEFKALKYRFAEETQCAEDQAKTEGAGGSYKGTLQEEVPGGNLGIEEGV